MDVGWSPPPPTREASERTVTRRSRDMSKTMPVLGALAMGLVASIAAAKTAKIDPTRMTCEEFVALERGVKPDVIAYLQGYSEGAKATYPVAVAVPGAVEVKYVETVCAEVPK